MISSAQPLLDYATNILNGHIQLPPIFAPRAAAFLTRQALEDIISALCRGAGASIDHASMRSKLIVLRVLRGDEIADSADLAWHGLSTACHHHAYELAPTAAEVGHLSGLVARLALLHRSNS